MDSLSFTLIICLFILLVGCYALFYTPIKEENENYRKKAFELTKTIGNKNIKCISLITNNFNGGKAFYLIEINAETDPDKFCCRLEEGWFNSAHSVETARKHVEKIIHHMPYPLLRIEDLNISESEFFKIRNYNKQLQTLDEFKTSDEDRMNLYFFPDFMEKELSIIRFTQTNDDFISYHYILFIDDIKAKKYIELFNYPSNDEEFAILRIENYISYYNQNNPWHGKINSTITYTNQEMFDFLDSHPLLIHQYLYNNLESIEPYYDSTENI